MRDVEGVEEVIRRLQPHMPEIEAIFDEENRRYIQLSQQDHDLIGRVLKCHLIVEHYLDRFLSSHLNIEELSDVKLSFYQKAKLLPSKESAAAFVKPGILKLNSIRNQFGHTLHPALTVADLGAINDVLLIARSEIGPEPIQKIEAFTTVAATFLIIPPPHLQEAFIEAFKNVRVNDKF